MNGDGKRSHAAANRSLVSSCLTLLGIPGYLICVTHICRCGHLVHAHGQLSLISDYIWIVMFISSAVFVVSSDTKLRSIQFSMLAWLVLSRVVILSGGGWLLLFELFGLLFVSCIALRTIYRNVRTARPTSG